MNSRFAVSLLVSLLIAGPAGGRLASAQKPGAEAPHDLAKSAEPYVPGIGDFMTAYVQPHHIKLDLAGIRENWELAGYEAKELREVFDDVVTYRGSEFEGRIRQMVETALNPALTAVDQAIQGRDKVRFIRAYEKLTAACNACHQATQHAFIVIRAPEVAAFPDQRFGR